MGRLFGRVSESNVALAHHCVEARAELDHRVGRNVRRQLALAVAGAHQTNRGAVRNLGAFALHLRYEITRRAEAGAQQTERRRQRGGR